MIQVKCGNCEMVINVSEKHFEKIGSVSFNKGNPFYCLSCNSVMPNAVLEALKTLVKTKDFQNWEIGGCFRLADQDTRHHSCDKIIS